MSAAPRAIGAEEALSIVEDVGASAPREALPALIGGLERVKASLFARLVGPAESGDRLIDVDEAAQLLGIAPSTLRHNADDYSFTVRPVPGRVRFSYQGIQTWLRRRRGERSVR